MSERGCWNSVLLVGLSEETENCFYGFCTAMRVLYNNTSFCTARLYLGLAKVCSSGFGTVGRFCLVVECNRWKI
jgi:hypothetical protein